MVRAHQESGQCEGAKDTALCLQLKKKHLAKKPSWVTSLVLHENRWTVTFPFFHVADREVEPKKNGLDVWCCQKMHTTKSSATETRNPFWVSVVHLTYILWQALLKARRSPWIYELMTTKNKEWMSGWVTWVGEGEGQMQLCFCGATSANANVLVLLWQVLVDWYVLCRNEMYTQIVAPPQPRSIW